MATKKQQKRRYRRTVGRGRVYDPTAVEERREPERAARSRGGRARPAQPPSWKRTGRRALVFSAIFLLATTVLPFGKMTTNTRLFSAVYLFLMFWIVGSMTEAWAWKRYLKKQGQSPS
ncbi:MAG TPA: hypothetical protein VMU66_04670 [Gaiellales bacterium]|nr:hypothetical protein [Gaiellales bacterium]